jgi:Flp pilus assembly secretin CpaC
VGTSLLVRPSSINKDYIKLEVTPEVSTRNRDDAGREVPGLDVRRSTQTVKMREGLSFALTTEVERFMDDEIARIPFLGELPVIGPAFRAKPVTTTRKLLLVITPTIGGAENSEILPPAAESFAEKPLPPSLNQIVRASAESSPAYQVNGYLNPISYKSAHIARSNLPTPAPVPQVNSVYPVPQTSSWNSQPAWGPANRIQTSRLSHLQNAFKSLTAVGLTVQADEVRKEIQEQKQADQRRILKQKKHELAALQAEVEALSKSLSQAGSSKVTHFRLSSLILSSTKQEFRKAGLALDEPGRHGGRFARVLHDDAAADAILEKCKQAASVTVLGSSTQLIANGERTSCQNGVEVTVPEVVQTDGTTEQQLSTGFRFVGSEIALTPKLGDDGKITLKAVLEFSESRNFGKGIVQVGGRSVPEINSRRMNTEIRLTSGQTILFGMPQDGGEVILIAVKVTTEE